MIPVLTLYDEYIDRPKLTEQKKTVWVYSSFPLKKGRNNNTFHCGYSQREKYENRFENFRWNIHNIRYVYCNTKAS